MAKAEKLDIVLPVGATHYPAAPGRPPEPIPKGVSIRSGTSVQIEFMWKGRRYTESLKGRPTETNVRAAVAKRMTVLSDIEYNKFVYQNAFPESRHARLARAEAAEKSKPAQVLMSDLFSDWVERYAKENPNSHNTLKTHREVIRSRLAPALGHYRPNEVTKDVVVNFRHDLRNFGLSDNRISNILTPLRGALDLAVERNHIPVNPTTTLTPTKPKHTKKVALGDDGNPAFDEPLPTDSLDPTYIKAGKNADPLDDEERKKVLQHMAGQVRNIFLFAMWTGLRTGELIALRWCDVSPDGLRVLVRLSFSKTVFTTTKGRRARWVDLTGPAVEVLRAQRELTGSAGKWVFHNPVIGDRWQNSERLRVRWKKAMEAGEVRYRKPYQTRHTYASLMVSAGESPEWVAEQMGHLDGRLVAQVYGRWLRPSKLHPGRAAAEVYAQEWEVSRGLIALADPRPSPEEVQAEIQAPAVDDEDDEDEV